MSEETILEHSVIMQDRKNLSISGVNDVKSFDEETVILLTKIGVLSIKGNDLKINGFSTTSKDINIEGKIYALIYSDEESGGFFKRLMK